jgi:hypothetical protein
VAGTFVYFERCCVAAVFILSSVWKIRHRLEFRAALMSVLGRLRPLRGAVQVAVPVIEVALALAVLLPARAGLIGAALAATVMVVFSGTLLRRDLSAGCGCWSAPRASRAALLTRNGLLFLLAVTSLVGTPALSAKIILAAIPPAILFALVIMEVPSILQYFADSQGVPP